LWDNININTSNIDNKESDDGIFVEENSQINLIESTCGTEETSLEVQNGSLNDDDTFVVGYNSWELRGHMFGFIGKKCHGNWH